MARAMIDLPLRRLYSAVRSGEDALRRVHASHSLKRKVDKNLASLHRGLPASAFSFDLEPAREFLSTRFHGYRDIRWHLMYWAATNRHALEYVPEDLFYVWIHPQLNPPERVVPYRDKNHAEFLGVAPAPEAYARVIRGRLVAADRRSRPRNVLLGRIAEAPDVVLKPARSARQGLGIRRGPGAEIAELLDTPGDPTAIGDWVVQAAIPQHPSIACLNPSSLNTFRVLTLRIDKGIQVLSTVLRVGRAGAVVDNMSAGGVGVNVSADGALANTAYLVSTMPTLHHPDHGFSFGTARVPATDQLHDACRAAHDAIPELDLVAWDAAIRPDGTAVLLEANVAEPGISIHQLCTGPLFGAWTDHVVTPRRVRMLGPWLR